MNEMLCLRLRLGAGFGGTIETTRLFTDIKYLSLITVAFNYYYYYYYIGHRSLNNIIIL